MPRGRRAAAKAAAQSIKDTPQVVPEGPDEEMADDVYAASPPRDDDNKSDVVVEEPEPELQQTAEEGDTEREAQPETTEQPAEKTETSTPALDTEPGPGPEPEKAPEQDTPRAGRISALPLQAPRRRRPGRPPKNRPPDWQAPLVDDPEGHGRADVGTPVKRRGRGRPAGGGRWGRAKGGPSHVSQVPVDKEGNLMQVLDDEVVLPEDPEGEAKVDKMGNLLGGREYRVRTFKIGGRGDAEYMLSTEPARCIGFRDSYLFFQKHKMLYKIILTQEEKMDLIARDIMPHSYKGRAIGVVTARSVFREFGAKIIIGGRKVVDDYYAKEAREQGAVEGELAVPDDPLPRPGEPYDKNRYVAWHGASAVYHSGAPSVPMTPGKVVDSKKRKVVVTGDNWMVEHAREASRFNSALTAVRQMNISGTYDIHTNIMMYPKIMQPTVARWEPIEPPESDGTSRQRLITRAKAALDKPDADGDISMEKSTEETDQNTTQNGDSSEPNPSDEPPSTIFPPVTPMYSRNFAIHDLHFESAPDSTLGNPGPDGHMRDIGNKGLIEMTDNGEPGFNMPPEVLAELPAECREAYLEAAAREYEWKNKWKGETGDGLRAHLPLNFHWK